MSDGLVECFKHGMQEQTFVCVHIVESLSQDASPGFVCYPGPDDAFPDAWCNVCESRLNANGGEWTRELEQRADISLLCASCYVSARDLAESDGQLKVFM